MPIRHLLSMTAILFAGTLASGKVPVPKPSTIPAGDSRITFIGRTRVQDGTVSFDWTGVYARIHFRGNWLTMNASDTKKNYYNVWLDGDMAAEPDKVIAVHGTDTAIALFTAAELKARFGRDRKAAAAGHTVVIQKRTEGEQGTSSIGSFSTDGEFLQAEGARERVIEYIGDSYTCGYGSENSVRTDPFTPETENQNKTYACAIARYFGADWIVTAHSGMGIARNYNDNMKGDYMPGRYLRTFDMDKEAKWDPAHCPAKPDITVIYLGTNDFSTSRQPSESAFSDQYLLLLNEIKAFYGEEHPILCIAPKNDVGMFGYISRVVQHCGLKNVHAMALTPPVHDSQNDLGASWHPNYAGHIKKAYAILPYISTLTGWEMSEHPVK